MIRDSTYFISETYIIFSLNFEKKIEISVCCLGKIISPRNGEEFVFLPGSTGNLTWNFDDDISTIRTLNWYFIPSGGTKQIPLAAIRYNNSKPMTRIENCSICGGLVVWKPATLVLKNVNQSYNGTYQFQFNGQKMYPPVNVQVFIASKFY